MKPDYVIIQAKLAIKKLLVEILMAKIDFLSRQLTN
jgi:hypothetical protein